MKIEAGTRTIDNIVLHEERQFIAKTPGGLDLEDRPVRRIVLSGGIAKAEIDAMAANDWLVTDDAGKQTTHKGFNQLMRHEIVFAGMDEAESQAQERVLQLSDAIQELAASGVITGDVAEANQAIFPEWQDCIGKRAKVGYLYRHSGQFFRVNDGQEHTIQADWPPDTAVSLYSRVGNPADEYPEYIAPTGAHDAYSEGDKFTFKGKRYIVIHPGKNTYTWNPETYPQGTREVTD